jgi:hypothetical protein
MLTTATPLRSKIDRRRWRIPGSFQRPGAGDSTASQLHERQDASDFETKTQDKLAAE